MTRQRMWNVAAVCAIVANLICIWVLTMVGEEIKRLHLWNRNHYETHHPPSTMNPDALRWSRQTFDPTPRATRGRDA